MAEQRPRRRRIAGEARPGAADAETVESTDGEATPDVEETPAPSRTRPKVSRPTRSRRADRDDPAPAAVSGAAAGSSGETTEGEDDESTEGDGGADVVSPSPDAPVRPEDDRVVASTTRDQGAASWSRPLKALAALAVVSAVFGVYGVYSGASTWLGARGVDSAQSQAAQQAATDVEQIFSYDYDKLDEHLADAKELMTPAFAKEFDSISPALTDLAPQRKIQVKASSREAAPVPCGDDCSDSSAQVTVFFDQARLADGASQPTVFGNRVLVDMTKDGGTWKVSDIKAL